MINQDYHTKHFPRIPRHQEGIRSTTVAVLAVLACFTLMSWSCTEKYNPIPVSQYIDKQNVKRLTADELARQTALVNAELERRAKK